MAPWFVYGCASVMKFQIEKEICCAIAMNTNARMFSPHVACVNASTVWMVLVFNQLFMTSIARCRMHILRVQKDRNFFFAAPFQILRQTFLFLNPTLKFVIHIIYAFTICVMAMKTQLICLYYIAIITYYHKQSILSLWRFYNAIYILSDFLNWEKLPSHSVPFFFLRRIANFPFNGKSQNEHCIRAFNCLSFA